MNKIKQEIVRNSFDESNLPAGYWNIVDVLIELGVCTTTISHKELFKATIPPFLFLNTKNHQGSGIDVVDIHFDMDSYVKSEGYENQISHAIEHNEKNFNQLKNELAEVEEKLYLLKE